jgi:hypothetical protein
MRAVPMTMNRRWMAAISTDALISDSISEFDL